MTIESIEQKGVRYAEIIWADTLVEKATLFSPPESSFKFGLLAIVGVACMGIDSWEVT
jgi:hypothetical protein